MIKPPVFHRQVRHLRSLGLTLEQISIQMRCNVKTVKLSLRSPLPPGPTAKALADCHPFGAGCYFSEQGEQDAIALMGKQD